LPHTEVWRLSNFLREFDTYRRKRRI